MHKEAPLDLPLEALSDDPFTILVHAIKDYAIFLLDADGRVASWNEGARRITGYQAHEIQGKHFSSFYTDDSRAAGQPALELQNAIECGSFEAEGWRVRKDGTPYWSQSTLYAMPAPGGGTLGFAAVMRDISEKREADQALSASEQRFRLLVQGVRDYAIYMLDAEGRITNWNSGAALIKGYSSDEIIGRHFSLFYTPQDRERGEPERGLRVALERNGFQTEAWRVRKDGSHFWANVLIEPIFGENKELVGFAKVTRDITERKREQEKTDRQREALHHSQKLEAIGRLTGSVAHDFNNLLAIIRTAADLLEATPDLTPQKRKRYVTMISETAGRAARLTEQLLAFARRQPLRPETFSPEVRIRALEQMIETSLGSNIELTLEFPQTLPCVKADANQFETAVLNMVINARDATPSGGKVSISAYPTSMERISDDGGSASQEMVAIAIADTGTGIEPAILQNIFEPFFTTKSVHNGTGLGLSQVYGFAKQSEGDVAVESTVGEGSRFILYLPCATADPEASGWDDILSPLAQQSMKSE